MKVLGILASHKNDGLTAKMLDEVMNNVDDKCEKEILYLEDYQITPNIYGKSNENLDLIEEKLTDSDVWIFAAPTYWRSLSGVLKNFFDCMRPRMVKFKENGDTLPGKFKNKHYLSITSCYVSTFENFVTGVTDESFRIIDRVMAAAGVIKLGEIVLPGTFGMKELPESKKKLCAKYGKKVSNTKRKDDSTLKRYIQLFFMVALTIFAAMGIIYLLKQFTVFSGFWVDYASFTVVFYLLLAGILHFATVVKHRRR